MIGAGTIGSVVIKELAKTGVPVTVGDKYESAGDLFKGIPNVRFAQVDVADRGKLVEFLKGNRVVVHCSLYAFNLPIMEAALEAGAHYIDLGGLYHMTLKQLPLKARFEKAGLSAILGLGSTPGTTNVMVKWGADRMDKVRRVSIFSASHEETKSDVPFSFPYSLDTVLDELTMEAPIFRNGEIEFAKPMSEQEEVNFPSPVGKVGVRAIIHSEQATLPGYLKAKGVEYLAFKFALPEELVGVLQALADLGLALEEGRKLLRRHAYDAARKATSSAPPGDWDAMQVVLEGEADRLPTTYRLETLVSPADPPGISAGTWATAIPPVIGARWLLDGKLKARGVFPPEEIVDPEPFFRDLASYNIRMTCRKEFPLYLGREKVEPVTGVRAP